MKKNNPVFGVLFAVVVAAIFLAVSFPSETNVKMARPSSLSSMY